MPDTFVPQPLDPIPDTMPALTLDGVGVEHLQLRRVPVPRPGPGQLLARVDAAGICTSLLKLIDQGPAHSLMYGWDITLNPAILGDEGAVTIAAVGAELTNKYRPGERYVVQPAVDIAPINHRARYANQARAVNKIAVGYTLPGHLAEYMLIAEEILTADCLIPLPDAQMPYAHAAVAEPLSCIVSSQEHHLHLAQESPAAARAAYKGLKPGGVTVIVGSGPMGRMHVDLALSYRPRVVIATDRHEENLARVRALFGARAAALGVDLKTVNTALTDVPALVAQVSGDRGADDVIIAVGKREAIESGPRLVGRGGVLNLFGGLKRGEDVLPFDTSLIHYREINITGSSGGSPWDMARTLELIAGGRINAASHITRIGGLHHAPEFLRMIRSKEIDGKAVVYPHRQTERILAVGAWTAEDEAQYLSR